jgi:hypothetical protein
MHSEMQTTSAGLTTVAQLPTRRYFTRKEAAAWLSVSVDTFMSFDIPFYDLGPRCKRWDRLDIEAFVSKNKVGDSARTTAMERQRKGQSKCRSTNGTAHRTGGQLGMTRMESDIAEVLELPTKS